MAATFGDIIRVTLFGQSHSESIGAVVDGLPAGIRVDTDGLGAFMDRRRGEDALSTKRRESDIVRIVSGVANGVTCGAPLCLMIDNTDVHSSDYGNISAVFRPSHSDFPAYVKYSCNNDISGGGQYSGRMTAALCAAGYFCLGLLKDRGITVVTHIARIGGICDDRLNSMSLDCEVAHRLAESRFPVINDKAEKEMKKTITDIAAVGDSVGGAVECAIYGLKPGMGGDFFGGLEGQLSRAVFSVPAVKGIEFGLGFGFAGACGSDANDPFSFDNSGAVVTAKNNCGGILGGLSSGMPIVFTAAIKPTPSIALSQQSVDITTHKLTELTISGRHDPCIVPRACAAIEAAAAIAIVNSEGFFCQPASKTTDK